MKQQYEYDLLYTTANLNSLKDQLNAKAKEGWRVIAVIEGMVIILERLVK